MKQVGIWIDKKEAKIISIKKGNEQIQTIQSDIEYFNPKGGSGTKFKGGPQDVVQDSKYLEREKHQFTEFINKISSIFGRCKFNSDIWSCSFGQKIE